MNLTPFYKSILDQDRNPIVICDTAHRILYMNPEAIAHYAKYGGEALLGKSVLDCHKPASRENIEKVLGWFAADPTHNHVHTMFLPKENLDIYMIALRDDAHNLIGYYEKQESRDRDETPFYQMH